MLEYLRNIGKFNTRHLWDNSDIAKADPKVIWELLDDIWHYFTNKNSASTTDRFTQKKSKSSLNTRKNVKFSIPRPSTNKITEEQYNTINLNEDDKSVNNGKFIENYYNINKDKQFEKYTDAVNYQKIISNNVTNVLNTSKERNKSMNINTNRDNLNIIANCLGIDSTRAKKKM